MAEPKTTRTGASVTAFLKKAAEGERHADALTLVGMMREATGAKPEMWGPTIIGFGSAPITYADGRVLDWPVAAFAPRKPAFVIYGTRAAPRHAQLLKQLGRAKMAGGCLHIKRLADVDTRVLEEIITTSVSASQKRRKPK